MSEAAARDGLAELRERLRATAAAAERLVDEAAAQGTGGAGADVPRAADEANQELRALVSLVELLRDLLPAELRDELAQVVRQILLLLRAVIDWWVARLESGEDVAPPEPVRVEDIPLS
ncbi:MAG: hypothetical protein MSC31_17250 [Solirubrobacteraceae bacterium MAG38_C4-C5]|nr:hypothetical protein [Candidatus Siliceabacter maunaloa]